MELFLWLGGRGEGGDWLGGTANRGKEMFAAACLGCQPACQPARVRVATTTVAASPAFRGSTRQKPRRAGGSFGAAIIASASPALKAACLAAEFHGASSLSRLLSTVTSHSAAIGRILGRGVVHVLHGTLVKQPPDGYCSL